MEPAAFLAIQRAANDKVSRLHQVAQFNQIVADAKMCVVVVNLDRKSVV